MTEPHLILESFKKAEDLLRKMPEPDKITLVGRRDELRQLKNAVDQCQPFGLWNTFDIKESIHVPAGIVMMSVAKRRPNLGELPKVYFVDLRPPSDIEPDGSDGAR